MGYVLSGQAVEQPSQVNYQHCSLRGASTKSPLTQQQALPGVPIFPEPWWYLSYHQSAVKILHRDILQSLFEGTFSGAQGTNSKTILKNFIAELPLCLNHWPFLAPFSTGITSSSAVIQSIAWIRYTFPYMSKRNWGMFIGNSFLLAGLLWQWKTKIVLHLHIKA